MSNKKHLQSTKKADDAVILFDKGYNCAQAVILSYNEELGINADDAAKLTSGFGAGMGRLQEVCGAVTGAFLVISLKYGSPNHEDATSRERAYSAIQAFEKKFSDANNSIICRDLLGVDLIAGDKQENLGKVRSVCPKMVRDAVMILEELFLDD